MRLPRPTDRPGGASFGPSPAARSAGAPSTCRYCRQITHDTEKCAPLILAAPSGCVRSAPQFLPISDIPLICKDCYLPRQPLFCAPSDPSPPTTQPVCENNLPTSSSMSQGSGSTASSSSPILLNHHIEVISKNVLMYVISYGNTFASKTPTKVT